MIHINKQTGAMAVRDIVMKFIYIFINRNAPLLCVTAQLCVCVTLMTFNIQTACVYIEHI